MLTIGILFGGKSVEHDVSIISAYQVMKAIKIDKYRYIPLYLTKDGTLLTGERFKDIETYKQKIKPKKGEYGNLVRFNNCNYLSYTFKKFKKWLKIDLILPIVHGKGVEDGNISGFLEILQMPYITSDVLGASICQDKEFTKIILNNINIKTIPYQVLLDHNIDNLTLKYPLIIKPAKLGSSIGINRVDNNDELKEAINEAFKYDNKVIVEKALTNFKEYSVAIYAFKNELILSDIEELELTSDIYKFTDKYQNNSKEVTGHKIPAKISTKQQEEIYEITRKIYQKLQLSGVIRVDFLYDMDSKKLYVNEINTIPGSLAFYLFEKKGKSFDELLDDLIKQTLINKEKSNEYISAFDSNILEKNTLKMKK